MIYEVCVVSASPALALELEQLMSDERIAIEHSALGEVALSRAACGCSSVLLLDEDPADMTVAEVLRHLSNSDTGRDTLSVILSERSAEIDRVIAFELGADDFIPKPIGGRELALRLRAVLRRHSNERKGTPVLRVGPFTIDTRGQTVTCHGEALRLTSVEFRLLEHLARNSGQVQDRRELLARVWKCCDASGEPPGHSRTVDTHVKWLRAKLGADSKLIETIRGVGYRLRMAG